MTVVANVVAADKMAGLIAMTANVMSVGTAMDRHLCHALIVDRRRLIGEGNCVRGKSRDAGQ